MEVETLGVAQPWMEGAYALRQGLSGGNAIHAPVRLSQAAGPSALT